MDTQHLAHGVVRWTGYGSSAWPQRDDDALVREFGEPDGLDLLAALKTLEADFYASDAHLNAHDLRTMGDQAAAEFRAQHPDVPDEVVAAFTWCYTFDYK